jgi:sensor c-di-GMP phosphodiesterase-like protein
MLSMGNELGLEIIAEGIESEEQADFLRARGCQGGQGYLYGKPAPAVSFARTRTEKLSA